MNKLVTTYTGGMPLDLDDIKFWDDAIRAAFEGLLKAFNPYGNMILSGCIDDGTNVSEGYVAINGEVCYFPGVVKATVPLTPGPISRYYFDLDITTDSAGLEVFENGVSHDTYQVRQAKLYHGGAWSVAPFYPTLTLKNIWQTEFWHEVDAVGEPPILSFWTQNVPYFLQFKKRYDGMVFFRGIVDTTNPAAALATVFVLPAGYRPTRQLLLPASYVTVGGIPIGTCMVKILTTGEVSFFGLDFSGASQVEVYLDGISFLADNS